MKALEAQRHQQEIETVAREAEEECRRHREAYLRHVFVLFRAVRPALIEGAMAIQEGVQGQSQPLPLIRCSSVARTPAVARAALQTRSQWMTD